MIKYKRICVLKTIQLLRPQAMPTSERELISSYYYYSTRVLEWNIKHLHRPTVFQCLFAKVLLNIQFVTNFGLKLIKHYNKNLRNESCSVTSLRLEFDWGSGPDRLETDRGFADLVCYRIHIMIGLCACIYLKCQTCYSLLICLKRKLS